MFYPFQHFQKEENSSKLAKLFQDYKFLGYQRAFNCVGKALETLCLSSF